MIQGVGKSRIIETLTAKLNYLYGDPANTQETGWIVIVIAPTGLAAYNVKGMTAHRFFKLPVFKDSRYDRHWQLSDAALKIQRQLTKKVRLIIGGL